MVTRTTSSSILHPAMIEWPVSINNFTTLHGWLIYVAGYAVKLFPNAISPVEELVTADKSFKKWASHLGMAVNAVETGQFTYLIEEGEDSLFVDDLRTLTLSFDRAMSNQVIRISTEFYVIREELAPILTENHQEWDSLFRAIYNAGWHQNDSFFKAAMKYCKYKDFEVPIHLLAMLEPHPIEYLTSYASEISEIDNEIDPANHVHSFYEETSGCVYCIECGEVLKSDGFSFSDYRDWDS